MNNLPPAKRLFLLCTCRKDAVSVHELSRYMQKGHYRYNLSESSDYSKQLAIIRGDARAFILHMWVLRLIHVEALTRLRGSWFFRIAPSHYPHLCNHFLAGLSASDFYKLRSPIAQWVKRWSAYLAARTQY